MVHLLKGRKSVDGTEQPHSSSASLTVPGFVPFQGQVLPKGTFSLLNLLRVDVSLALSRAKPFQLLQRKRSVGAAGQPLHLPLQLYLIDDVHSLLSSQTTDFIAKNPPT